MYKKRISAWGFKKQIKADEKDKAIAEILHNEPTTANAQSIRHDKLVRHAKSRAKSGALDGHYLNKIVKREVRSRKISTSTIERAFAINQPLSSFNAAFLTRSPALPDRFANFDLFLRAMQSMIEKERGEWLAGRNTSPSIMFDALTEGLSCWRRDDFTQGRLAFGHAADIFNADISGSDVSVSRIAYCVSSIVWGSVREPAFLLFAQFMAKSVLDAFGPLCPLTIVLQHLQLEQNLEAQLAIWACALHNYQVSEGNVKHWWSMAQRRWRWCLKSQMRETAAGYKIHAMAEVRRVQLLMPSMEEEAERDFIDMAGKSEA